ncbi:MAG: glycosyl hydrolase 53 family protein [Lewinellaceae bacterium]|nr:glycosyl hydrolase 53 family protein [Lewinellaceae bacterium]
MRHFLLPAICACFFLCSSPLSAQSFYFGADLSYVNEMEDCGVVYQENGQPKAPYQIFADHGCNLVRLRLWHTPDWYDSLNGGQRYSDLADVKRSLQKAKAAGMSTLLDFHLSDTWADPSRQLAPAAWLDVVDNLPVLQDSLYHYIYNTLMALDEENLLPEMVQVGNETNRGILLSPEVNNSGWVLDWARNSQLFNTAIQAIRDVESATDTPIRIALHIAGPADATWYFNQFIEHGVTDFDIMGISYYWAWHKPTSIAQTAQIIAGLRGAHPGYDVMIFETAYPWTLDANDNAANIINEVHPDYLPVSPENQEQWLVDLTQAVISSGGKGVIYWEPAWVSSSCYTLWGQGSHQEHATFFDFESNLLNNGGVGFMSYPYLFPTASNELPLQGMLKIFATAGYDSLIVQWDGPTPSGTLTLELFDSGGSNVLAQSILLSEAPSQQYSIPLPQLPEGIYFAVASLEGKTAGRASVWLGRQ